MINACFAADGRYLSCVFLVQTFQLKNKN